MVHSPLSMSARRQPAARFARWIRRFRDAMLLTVLSLTPLAGQERDRAPVADNGDRPSRAAGDNAVGLPRLECDVILGEEAAAAIEQAVRRGEIVHPADLVRPLPPAVASHEERPPCATMPTSADIFPFEDSDGLLLTNFSNGQLFGLMTNAANQVIAQHGDQFDFVAFWVNFTPARQIGTAFYLGVFNDVAGIGQGPFNSRGSMGLASNEVEGYVMMWNINQSFWQPGTDTNSASFTRLVLGQEFEHRFGMFLPNLPDGRRLQGDNAGCGRGAHWNFKVDGQGSGMEIREWIGSSPAVLGGNCVSGASDLCFNTDIGGVFSFTDLYLMGYVSPAEMDAGNSELRYMNNSCVSPYNGPISNFTSSDIIASAGSRNPTSVAAQKNFRTAWVMIHQPGAPPTTEELDKAAGILSQFTVDWNTSTLGRGTMCNTLTLEGGAIPKFSQRPLGAGEALTSNLDISDQSPNLVAADDFVSDGRPVTAVRWWGSRLGGPVAPFCGDDVVNQPQEDCDGIDDAACPGECLADCTCPPGPLCGPGAGNCCMENDTAGCNNVDCCQEVCACDPFCCDTRWDAACAGPNNFVEGCSALDLCPDCAPPECGNNIREAIEECDGTDEAACPAECREDCTCPPPDGFLLSFHEPLEEGGSALPALGLYFCDASVLTISQAFLPSCDGLSVKEYLGALEDCCLLHAGTDSRSGTVPAQPEAFIEEECFTYALDVQAVIGARYEDDGNGNCPEISTGRTADEDFWGWRTTDQSCGEDFLPPLQPAMSTGVSMDGSDWLYGPWNAVTPACSESNIAFELLTSEPPVGGDQDGNCVPDLCECPNMAEPQPGSPDLGSGAANRSIAVLPAEGGRNTALKVVLRDLPEPYNVWNDGELWVTGPRLVTENPNDTGSAPPGIILAGLSCTQDCRDWVAAADGGSIHIVHEGIIPDARYEVITVDCDCPAPKQSAPISLQTSRRGDLAGPFVPPATWPPPDGATTTTDLVAAIDKFLGKPTAPSKARTDVVGFDDPPQCVDLRVLIADILHLVDMVLEKPFPFSPTAPDPCDSPCALP